MPPDVKPGAKPGATATPQKRQDALGNKIPDPNEELALLEKDIQELKVSFEQYLAGIDRHSPTRRRDQLNERIRRMKSAGTMRNTAVKFRFEQLSSKFSSYDRMWTRQLADMEAGKTRRDDFRLKQRAQKLSVPPPPKKKGPAESAPPPSVGLTDGQLRALYDAYVFARQRTNESLNGLSYDGLAGSLRKQVPELMSKHGAKAIDFKVVIKAGRALIKAVPRK